MKMVHLKYLLNVVALIISFSTKLESCEPGCLISRLEHYPCDHIHSSTRRPGINEYGDYRTRFAGYRCEILRHRHYVDLLPSASNNCGSIYCIKSPNKMPPELHAKYRNNKLTFYNIQCAPEELIYIDMIEMDIESTTCWDESTNSPKCVDYVQVRTLPDGNIVTDNCGTDKTNLDGKIIQSSSIQIIFRSDPQNRAPGFVALVQCFSPSRDRDYPNIKSTESQTSQTLSWAKECEAHTHERVTVPYGQNVLYEVSSRGSNLSFVETMTNRKIKSLQMSPIRYLKVRSLDDTKLDYVTKKEVNNIHTTTYYSPNLPTLLRGPGILYVPVTDAINFACFQDYIIDTSQFIPSVKEKKLIREINYALKRIILDDTSKILGESSRTSNINTLQEDRGSHEDIDAKLSDSLPSMKKYSFHKTDVLSDQVFLHGLTADLSNPILKVSVDSLLEALQRDNPKRFKILKTEAGRD